MAKVAKSVPYSGKYPHRNHRTSRVNTKETRTARIQFLKMKEENTIKQLETMFDEEKELETPGENEATPEAVEENTEVTPEAQEPTETPAV